MSGQQALFPDAGDGADVRAVDAQLAQAMLLFRASTMKMLQLQLAMERRDRAVALQSLDDLVALDARIAALLDEGASGEALDAIAREVDDQRSALLREKFGLAAGLVRRAAEAQPWVEVAPAGGEMEVHEGEATWPGEEPRRLRQAPLLIAAVFLILLAAIACAGLLLGWRAEDGLALLFGQGG